MINQSILHAGVLLPSLPVSADVYSFLKFAQRWFSNCFTKEPFLQKTLSPVGQHVTGEGHAALFKVGAQLLVPCASGPALGR